MLSQIGYGELLAIFSSLAYSVTLVSIRQGVRSGTPLTPLLIINTCNSIAGLSIAFWRGTLQTTALEPILWFILTGIVGQGSANILLFTGIEKMGVTRASPIASCAPLWATFLAIAFLGEQPGEAVLVGTLAIIVGVFLLSVSREREMDFRSWFRGALIFPLSASFLLALIPIFAKFAFAHQNTPFLGMGVAFGTGGLAMLVGRPFLPGGGIIRADNRALRWFALGATINVMASLAFWSAIFLGDVSIVMPLTRIVPMWVVLWSYFFLGDLERITWPVVAAVSLIVTGGVLITAIK